MVLVDRTKAWKIGGRNFATDFGRALNSIEANQSAQMAALAMFYYASLYVVIEGWRDKNRPRPSFATPGLMRCWNPPMCPRWPIFGIRFCIRTPFWISEFGHLCRSIHNCCLGLWSYLTSFCAISGDGASH